MYFYSFHAVPTIQSDFPLYGGAYVSCWIQDSNINTAEQSARLGIENTGWTITKIEDEAVQTNRDDWDDESLEYFDQALIDDEVWVYHCYPLDDSDEE